MALTVAEKKLAAITPTHLEVAPSCDQVLGSVVFRDCIANESSQKNFFAILTGFWTVTPLTNITPVSLWYQSYLNVIFHRTNLAFYCHAVTMPLVVLFLCAFADRYHFADADEHEWARWINVNFVIVVCFFIWYSIWGFAHGIWWLGPCALPVLGTCYIGGHYYNRAQYGSDNAVYRVLHPMLLSAAAAFIQSSSHLLEDLPPRVSGSLSWTKKSDFVCRRNNTWVEMLFRTLRLIPTALVFGPFDEWTASPRLLPLFWSLWPVKTLMKWCHCDCCGTNKKLEEKFEQFEKMLHPEHRVEVTVNDKDLPVVAPLSGDLNAFGALCDWLARKLCCEAPPKLPLMIPNPALDYVGLGGAAYMIVDKKIDVCDVLCCRFSEKDISLNAEAGMRQTWRLHESTAIGVSKPEYIPGQGARELAGSATPSGVNSLRSAGAIQVSVGAQQPVQQQMVRDAPAAAGDAAAAAGHDHDQKMAITDV